jgi:hypothetical protein
VLVPRRKTEGEKEYKCNVILKRLKSEQKIMFAYWKLGQICVWGDVFRVAKLSVANLVVSLHYPCLSGPVSCSMFTISKIYFMLRHHQIVT